MIPCSPMAGGGEGEQPIRAVRIVPDAGGDHQIEQSPSIVKGIRVDTGPGGCIQGGKGGGPGGVNRSRG